MLPLQGDLRHERELAGHLGIEIHADGPDPKTTDLVMLVRKRKSRILYSGKLFDYPISPSVNTFRKLGLYAQVLFVLPAAGLVTLLWAGLEDRCRGLFKPMLKAIIPVAI